MSDLRATWPADQWADLGGRRLRYWSVGDGTPTIVCESGLGSPVVDWVQVLPELSRRGRVLCYDRAGIGNSEPSSGPRDAEALLDDLAALLQKADAQPPYVLVAHSWGGVVARLFALRNPELVAGMVLIDVTHEETVSDRSVAANQRSYAVMERLAKLRLLAPLLTGLGSLRHYGADERAYLVRKIREVQTITGARAEAAGMAASLALLRAEAPSGAAVPTVVLSAGGRRRRRGPIAKTYARLHEAHARLVPPGGTGRHEVVPGCGHHVQVERPDAVVRAVDDVLAARGVLPPARMQTP